MFKHVLIAVGWSAILFNTPDAQLLWVNAGCSILPGPDTVGCGAILKILFFYQVLITAGIRVFSSIRPLLTVG